MAKVARAKEYIAAGDIFQVVLSQRFEAPFHPALFRALSGAPARQSRRPSSITSISATSPWWAPARRSWSGCATARSPSARSPARGRAARRRSRTRRWPRSCSHDAKERAEHLMLLDLGRNDVGRVAEVGSVRVTELVLPRILQPGDAHRVECRGQARFEPRCGRCTDGRLPRRHRVRRAEGPRHGDHR